jgi:hypothetical protein
MAVRVLFGGVGIWLGVAALLVGMGLGVTRPYPESWVCASIGVLAFVVSVVGRLAMIPRRAARPEPQATRGQVL